LDSQSLILVVDDQIRSQIALASLLETEGYRVAFATNGPEALAQMHLLTPDLVLLDVMMPEMDGFEVCRRLRADPALAFIPVVMVTALDDRESLLSGIEAGADDFISKPFNRAELRARVRTITRLNRFRILLDKQRAVSSEHAQFLWAIERSADGYLLLDHEDRLHDGNPQGLRYLGLHPQSGKDTSDPFREIVGRHYRLEPREAWAAWPMPTDTTRYLVRPSGADPELWLKVDLLDLPHGVAGSRLVHLQEATAKITLHRNIWTFHSFVSHKLRTPLTSLLIGMGLLHQRAEMLPKDLAMLTETAYDGAQRLKGVVDDIFTYLDAPILHSQSKGVSLESLPDLITRIGTELTIPTIQIAAQLGPGAHRLRVTAQTMELLLTEILENARKFHPSHTPAINGSVLRQGEMALIRVCDDGMTLTSDQLRRIWQPYQQINDDFTGQVPGVGLGLAMVAQICWAAGGTCRVANRPDGPGITVELELPLGVESSSAEKGAS